MAPMVNEAPRASRSHSLLKEVTGPGRSQSHSPWKTSKKKGAFGEDDGCIS